MQLDRRTFQTGVAAAGLGLMAGAVLADDATSSEAPLLPIVDTHQHLWDLTKLNLPWLQPGGLLGRDFVMKDYRAAIEGTGISRAVYMEVDVVPEQKQLEADELLAICKAGVAPTEAAVLGGDPSDENLLKFAKQFEGSPYVRGFRKVLGGSKEPGDWLTDRYRKNVQGLGELGLSYDLCMSPNQLPACAKLAADCPDMLLIVDHCGNADPQAFRPSRHQTKEPEHQADAWRRDMDKLAEQKHVICKISGVVARVWKGWTADDLAPIVNHCLDAFGPDRVVFGSDWPVCLSGGATLKEWVVALRQIIADRPADEQKKLLSENAIRHYRLPAMRA